MASHHFPWSAAFLASLREMPIVQRACDAVGIERSTAYRARHADPEFAKAWDDALESGIDRAEQEAFRRAVTGFEEPVVYQGQPTYLYERDERGNIVHDIVQREVPDAEGGMKLVNVSAPRLKLDANGQPMLLTVRKHSDAMLGLILKGRRKSVYSDRTELTSPDGSMSPVVDEGARAARAAQLLALAQARKNAAGDPPVPDDFDLA